MYQQHSSRHGVGCAEGSTEQQPIISRADARKMGFKHYYTGVACLHGHFAKRLVSCGQCVVCGLEYVKRRYREDYETRERVKRYNQYHYQKNKTRANVRSRARHAKNKHILGPKKAAYMRANKARWAANAYLRRRVDEDYRLRQLLSSKLNRAIHRSQRGGAFIKDLGCSIEFLKAYIEAKFAAGMSWENWGVIWQIDHIRPCRSFDLTDGAQYLQACHYTNLQPLTLAAHKAKTDQERAFHPQVA